MGARNQTYPIPIPCLEPIPEPNPMLESILISESIPKPIPELMTEPIPEFTPELTPILELIPIPKSILNPEPIPDPILIPEPILESISKTDSGLTILNRFQKTSELAGIDSDEIFPVDPVMSNSFWVAGRITVGNIPAGRSWAVWGWGEGGCQFGDE